MKARDEETRKKEILRYLRYWNEKLDSETEQWLLKSMHLIRQTARPRKIHQSFELEKTSAGLRLTSSSLVLPGKHIDRHLANCDRAELMAATLGTEIDLLLQTTFRRDAAQAIILDAAANQYIEEICDELNLEIANHAQQNGYSITTRFSPGYGDLPLTIQPDILNILNATRRIGLTLTESNMLLPQKSVTAIIGLRTIPDMPNHPR